MNNHPCSKRKQIYVQKIKLEMVREQTTSEKIEIKTPEDIWGLAFLQAELAKSDREKFVCLHLDSKNILLSYEIVSVGSLNSSLVHPREVFKGAILTSSSSIIICHNHPSGDCSPSPEDITLTKRLGEAGDLLGISVLDHLIFGKETFTSCKEKGYL